MSSRYRAVLFDFDGTLADSYAAITASVNFVRARHSLPPMDEREVRTRVGHGLLELMAEIVPGGDPAADARLYLQHHPSVMCQHTHLLPGVAATLADLHAAGLRLAVCSNKPVAITRKLIEALGISTYFEGVFGPEDSGKPKPDPSMILLALEKVGVPRSQAVYVGDMPVDVETARNAGVMVYVLPTGSSDRETLEKVLPDRIFEKMAEISTVILSAD
jgi:phosphoglycolate phosphatase